MFRLRDAPPPSALPTPPPGGRKICSPIVGIRLFRSGGLIIRPYKGAPPPSALPTPPLAGAGEPLVNASVDTPLSKGNFPRGRNICLPIVGSRLYRYGRIDNPPVLIIAAKRQPKLCILHCALCIDNPPLLFKTNHFALFDRARLWFLARKKRCRNRFSDRRQYRGTAREERRLVKRYNHIPNSISTTAIMKSNLSIPYHKLFA